MNKYYSWLIILLMVLMLLFGIEVTSRCKDVEIQLQTERFLREQKELELEKEIRLLKQDVYLLKHGYEGAEDVRKD